VGSNPNTLPYLIKGHLGVWRRAVQLQKDRVLAPEFGPEFGPDRHIDSYLCVIAISQAFRAALEMLRVTGDARLREACELFQCDVPDAKDLRDVLTHFDAYERGNGHLQVAGAMQGLDIFTESGDDRFWLRINHMKIELGATSKNIDNLVYEAFDAADRYSTSIHRSKG